MKSCNAEKDAPPASRQVVGSLRAPGINETGHLPRAVQVYGRKGCPTLGCLVGPFKLPGNLPSKFPVIRTRLADAKKDG